MSEPELEYLHDTNFDFDSLYRGRDAEGGVEGTAYDNDAILNRIREGIKRRGEEDKWHEAFAADSKAKLDEDQRRTAERWAQNNVLETPQMAARRKQREMDERMAARLKDLVENDPRFKGLPVDNERGLNSAVAAYASMAKEFNDLKRRAKTPKILQRMEVLRGKLGDLQGAIWKEAARFGLDPNKFMERLTDSEAQYPGLAPALGVPAEDNHEYRWGPEEYTMDPRLQRYLTGPKRRYDYLRVMAENEDTRNTLRELLRQGAIPKTMSTAQNDDGGRVILDSEKDHYDDLATKLYRKLDKYQGLTSDYRKELEGMIDANEMKRRQDSRLADQKVANQNISSDNTDVELPFGELEGHEAEAQKERDERAKKETELQGQRDKSIKLRSDANRYLGRTVSAGIKPDHINRVYKFLNKIDPLVRAGKFESLDDVAGYLEEKIPPEAYTDPATAHTVVNSIADAMYMNYRSGFDVDSALQSSLQTDSDADLFAEALRTKDKDIQARNEYRRFSEGDLSDPYNDEDLFGTADKPAFTRERMLEKYPNSPFKGDGDEEYRKTMENVNPTTKEGKEKKEKEKAKTEFNKEKAAKRNKANDESELQAKNLKNQEEMGELKDAAATNQRQAEARKELVENKGAKGTDKAIQGLVRRGGTTTDNMEPVIDKIKPIKTPAPGSSGYKQEEPKGEEAKGVAVLTNKAEKVNKSGRMNGLENMSIREMMQAIAKSDGKEGHPYGKPIQGNVFAYGSTISTLGDGREAPMPAEIPTKKTNDEGASSRKLDL